MGYFTDHVMSQFEPGGGNLSHLDNRGQQRAEDMGEAMKLIV